MGDINYASVCGTYCGDCEFLHKRCAGCGYQEGRPFWTAQMPSKVCPLYDCCRNRKGLEHCGLCEDFPCKTFLEFRDPGMSDGASAEQLSQAQSELRRRKEIGTERWLSEKT